MRAMFAVAILFGSAALVCYFVSRYEGAEAAANDRRAIEFVSEINSGSRPASERNEVDAAAVMAQTHRGRERTWIVAAVCALFVAGLASLGLLLEPVKKKGGTKPSVRV